MFYGRLAPGDQPGGGAAEDEGEGPSFLKRRR